ncbi:CASP-like protein 5C3 isoform X3 [Diospyros lotus]|uniref:CASP-like protein 5C3 isoform X3 n=1 Tax=Diospyros lotus TaxID=55363 RepID=UPI0022552257|nr:CASP-like protein 5C3 isoform X3 [Diospyros lotus]
MDELPGALGTSASLALRLGQFIFSIASLIFMCLDVHFYAYTAFWYLATNCFYQKQLNSKSSTSIYGPCASFSVTIMSLMIPWSLTLAVVDVYFVLCKRPSRQPGIKFSRFCRWLQLAQRPVSPMSSSLPALSAWQSCVIDINYQRP